MPTRSPARSRSLARSKSSAPSKPDKAIANVLPPKRHWLMFTHTSAVGILCIVTARLRSTLPPSPTDEHINVHSFYTTWASLILFLWALFSLLGGGDFHRRGLAGSIITRPSWLPPRALLVLQVRQSAPVFSSVLAHTPCLHCPTPSLSMHISPIRCSQHPSVYLSLCHGTPFLLLSASVAPDHTLIRLAVAVFVSLYSLAESSLTHSHRDYPGCV